jgi:maleylacetate reductase
MDAAAYVEYVASPARVLFGRGTSSRVGEEVERLGAARPFLMCGIHVDVGTVVASLGDRLAGRFDGVVVHTPVEVTEKAEAAVRDSRADCLVTVGGGSATGLGKAVAYRTALPLIAVPTTYAGSEVTPVIGETAEGVKTTRTDSRAHPSVVVYDVDLTLDLPVRLSVTSGINALAHAVEALYSPQSNPITGQLALEALRRLASALPRIAADPGDAVARTDALVGAWLAGTCLGTVGMGVHHKLCHVLGGSFGLPHAETHTVVLPHAMAYNASAAPSAMRRIAEALGVPDAPAGVYDLVASLGGPTSLTALGFQPDDVDRAAALATESPYPNPAPLERDGIAALLQDAIVGVRPATAAGAAPDFGWLTDEVVASFAAAPEPRTRRLVTGLVRHLHRFAHENELTEAEWAYAIDFLTRAGHLTDDRRQEFVLLSDTLGVSSMVDLLTNSRVPGATPSAVLGPFYVAGPPALPPGSDIAKGLPGTPLWADVRVVDRDGSPVAGAVVDVWQSNDDGLYDVQLPDVDGPVLRARFTSNGDGAVRFWSIVPSEYPIPDDGPVGEMLAATGRHPWRAPHLHFMISAPGYRRLVTQLFVAGGAYLDSDTVFGVKEPLIVDFGPASGPPPPGRFAPGETGPLWHRLTYTFGIAPQADSGDRA